MTEQLVHKHDLFKTKMRNPFARRLLSSVVIAGGLLVAALIGLSTPHKAFVHSSEKRTAPAAETMKIVPSDALGTSGSWSPLTGDGSN